MSLYDSNLALLLERCPSLEDGLKSSSPGNLEAITTRSGSVSAVSDGVYIHSRIDPQREARRLILAECREKPSACIFFGFGLGYHMEAFTELYPHTPFLIVEPDPGFFRRALSLRDLAKVLTNPDFRLHLSGNPESVVASLAELPLTKPKIIRIRSVYQKNREFYQRLEGVVQSTLARRQINRNTLKRFGRLWIRNLVKNLDLLADTPGVGKVKGLFDGIPALVLASGPSLDNVLPLLPALAQRLLIIAVDTSLRACLDRGVEPDFLVIVDPQYWNTRHVDRARFLSSLLVCESSTHPRIFRSLNLPVLFGSSLFPLGRYIESFVGRKGDLGAGGSVATSAWDLARIAGANPIYVAGLDLGFPNHRTHFTGALFESLFHCQSERLRPAETMSSVYRADAAPFKAASNRGDLVLTDHRMFIYKWWFENQMKIHANPQTYNLSPAGVLIEGMELADPASLSELPPVRDRIAVLLDGVRTLIAQTTASRVRLLEALEGLMEELAEIRRVSEEALAETSKLRWLLKDGRDPAHSLDRLNRIDRRLLGMQSREIVSFLLQTTINEIMEETGHGSKEDPQEVLDRSERLYRELREASGYHLTLIGSRGREKVP
jgi:hypothetical protein